MAGSNCYVQPSTTKSMQIFFFQDNFDYTFGYGLALIKKKQIYMQASIFLISLIDILQL